MVCLLWSFSIFHVPTFCRFVFLMFHNQVTCSKYTQDERLWRSEQQKQEKNHSENECEWTDTTNRASQPSQPNTERAYIWWKKVGFTLKLIKKYAFYMCYVMLCYVMYVDKLLFWHWQNAQHAIQQQIWTESGKKKAEWGETILCGNNIIQCMCMRITYNKYLHIDKV